MTSRYEDGSVRFLFTRFEGNLPGNSRKEFRLFLDDEDFRTYNYQKQRCVVLGTSKPEVDHKNGWKNDADVMNTASQKFEDFQPLSKAANDAKRQFCKECRKTGKRYDAKKLGYPMSFYCGDENHNEAENGCVGCFWYDPIEFRKHLKFEK